MSDITLSDGREVEFDLSKMTIKEYRGLIAMTVEEADEYQILSKVSGLDIEEIENLPYPDWRAFARSFFKKAREPLADPNSVSESIME